MEDVLVLQDCVLVATNFKTGQDGFESRHIEEKVVSVLSNHDKTPLRTNPRVQQNFSLV